MIIGVGCMQEPPGRVVPEAAAPAGYPTLAQIGGHVLSSILLDGLSVDVGRIQRINRTPELLSPEQHLATPLQPVQLLVIAPGQRIDDIAARHQGDLPRPVRALLRDEVLALFGWAVPAA